MTARERAGARRAAHFNNGGTVAAWRGRAARFTDRKKQASKRACRNWRTS